MRTFTDTTAGFTLSMTSAKEAGALAGLAVIGAACASAACSDPRNVAPSAPEATRAAAATDASARLRVANCAGAGNSVMGTAPRRSGWGGSRLAPVRVPYLQVRREGVLERGLRFVQARRMRAETCVVRLDPTSYGRTPWKNGGGVTVDIAAVYEDGAEPCGGDGLIWRLGRTRIETAGPFSHLPHLDRILTVIDGHGLTLRAENGTTLDARQRFAPVAFPGEWPIVSGLDAGPVGVLNLMGDRRRVRIGVETVREGWRGTIGAGVSIIYGPAACSLVLDGEHMDVRADEALLVSGMSAAEVAAGSGTALMASISSL